jgi:hypothetical protein
MTHNPENIAVETALAEYTAVGAAPFLGELPEEANHWLEVLNVPEVELSPAQLLSASWLGIELGFQSYTTADRQRASMQHAARRNQDKRAFRGEETIINTAHTLMEDATNRLEQIMDTEDADPYIQAQAHLTYGAIPLIEIIRKTGSQKIEASKHRVAYRLAQAGAVNLMHDAVVAGELAPNERTFTRLLNVLAIGNSLVSNEIVVIPAPPRCYEDRADEQSWHLLFWDTRRGRHLPTALAHETALQGITAVLDRQTEEFAIFHEGTGLLTELHTAMLDPSHAVPRETSLGKAAVNVAGYFSSITGRRIPPVLGLPDLSRFSDRPGEPLEVPELPVDLDPIEYPEINSAALNEDTVLEWYGQQLNGRPLTRQEGLSLNRVLENFNRPAAYERLTLPERVTLNKMRLECAVALAGDFQSVAVEQLDHIASTTRPLQEASIGARDIISLYETAIDDLRLRIIGASIRGEPIELTKDGVIDELAGMLQEMDSEKNSLKDKDKILQLNKLTQDVLYSMLVMRFTSGPDIVALPALAREKGSDSRPGWNINTWRTNENDGNIILGSRLKVRVSESVDRPMRQGDIAVIPLTVIRKTASVKDIAKNFISLAREDERSRRAGNLLDKWGVNLRPVFDAAIELIN